MLRMVSTREDVLHLEEELLGQDCHVQLCTRVQATMVSE